MNHHTRMDQSFDHTGAFGRRARLSSREIALAVALTLAAGAFIFAALAHNEAAPNVASSLVAPVASSGGGIERTPEPLAK